MRRFHKHLFGIILIIAASFGGCTTFFAAKNVETAKTLNVGLYPWVPRVKQFQNALQKAWDQLGAGYTLNFVSADLWDGGYDTNPEHVDVFVFDAIHLEYFKKLGYLSAIEPESVVNANDILPYARNGVTFEEKMYGIPLLGCGNFLFYFKDDPLAQEETFSSITGELGNCSYTSEIPPDRRGLMLNMAGGTTNACLYLEVVSANTGSIPDPLPKELNASYINTMRQLMSSASYYNVNDCNLDGQCGMDQAYIRAEWFNKGHGRSYIGFTESMSQLDDETLNEIAFKPMPLSDQNQSPLFYSDIVGINPKRVTKEKFKMALLLANLMTSTEVVVESIGPDEKEGPQYLMPVRVSVFNFLSLQFPKYREMKKVVMEADPTLFVLGENSKPWIESIKNQIKQSYYEGYTCGCDFKSSPLLDQGDANSKCPEVCKDYGGWNGQWVSDACGCNACNIP